MHNILRVPRDPTGAIASDAPINDMAMTRQLGLLPSTIARLEFSRLA
jgi:phage terminase small subunit